jgi:hypothetical protein
MLLILGWVVGSSRRQSHAKDQVDCDDESQAPSQRATTKRLRLKERAPEWLTALSTMIQTVAIVATLIVAYREWSSHEVASRQQKADNVLRMYSDEPASVTDSRAFIGKVNSAKVCIELAALPHNYELSCDGKKELADLVPHFLEGTRALQTRISKVSACIEAGLCDAEIAQKLFCGDALMMDQAFHGLVFGYTFDDYVAAFLTRCQPVRDRKSPDVIARDTPKKSTQPGP